MKSLSLVTSLTLAVFLAACNGGGNRKTTGNQCPAVYNPINMDVGPNQKKLSLKATDEQIPAGIYKYDGSSLYYVDKSDLRMMAVDTKQKDGNFKGSLHCIRNAKNTLNPVRLEGIYGMNVNADRKKILADVNVFTIGLDAGKFKATAAKVQKTLESPKEVFDPAAVSFLVTTDKNTTDYELRSSASDANGVYFLSIRYKRTDQPAAPALPAPVTPAPGAPAPVAPGAQ